MVLEARGFGFLILLEARKPAVSKNQLIHCIRPESDVRYQSAEKSRILLREEVLATNRRNFLQSGSIVSVSLAFAKAGRTLTFKGTSVTVTRSTTVTLTIN
jgi:hypothetical protein